MLEREKTQGNFAMDIIKFPIRLLWRGSKTQLPTQLPTPSYILQLPVELLIEIFAFLPPHSQLFVYQTCRPFRTIIHQYFKRGEILITSNDKLNYLTQVTKSLPDRWVCATCLKIHQNYSWDTPTCPASYDLRCRGGTRGAHRNSESEIFFNYGYSPAHRHIELTLKYARLKSQKWTHQKHLQRLLKPFHIKCQKPGGISLQRSFYPKVIDGRYLLLTIKTYLGVKTPLSRQSMPYLRICPHLASFTTSLNRREIDLDGIFHMGFSAPPKTRTFSSCLACRTDVSIQVSPERVTICAWQDLGPEGTVYNLEWEAIVHGTVDLWHPAGSIRDLYGQQEHNGEIL
jgi:hypothetical protein